MKAKHYILLKPLFVIMALLMAACSSDTVTDEQPLPEGMGRIRITICTPEANPELTRAVNTTTPWLEPDHEWERLQTFRILICNTSNQVVQIISGTKDQMTAVTGTSYPYKESVTLTSEPLDAGTTYYIYATANYADGYTVGSTVNLDATASFYNGYSTTGSTLFGGDDALNTITKPIPMTGKLTTEVGGITMKPVTVNDGEETDAGTITVWRVMAKMQFYFTNEATEQIKVYGIEVEPINTNASDQGTVYLFSKDDLTSTANLPVSGSGTVTLPSGVTNGKVRHQASTTDPLLTLAAKNDGNTDEGTLFFYVNETNGTFTTTQNEISLRFKIKRGDATEEELRYGLTTHYGDGSEGQNGFNVIRRNDWIHIPIILTDWQMRIEPLALVPIAGYPAATVSSDGLTATYSTGGMIALQPFIKKKGDATWRNFGDPEVTFVSISWKNSDGTDIAYFNSDGTFRDGANPYNPVVFADHKIIKTAFYYDDVNQFIVGELDNNLAAGTYKTTITINVDLGKSPDPVYQYTFSCNVILTK